jgi:PKD repeat protein
MLFFLKKGVQMKPSVNLLRMQIIFIVTTLFMAVGFAPNNFVSSSHRQNVEGAKVVDHLPQATAPAHRSTGKNVGAKSNLGFEAVAPAGSPWVSTGSSPIDFAGSTYSWLVPTITVNQAHPNTAYMGNAIALAGNPNCDALAPSGGDDAIPIMTCLNTVGHVTLTQNTFLIYQPIAAIGFTNGVRITGTGKNTKIYAQFTCGDPRFLDAGTYRIPIEIRRSPNSVLSNFTLNLEQLRKDCGHGGNSAISINKSENSRVTGVRVVGSRWGDPGYTTGWVHGGGISVVNSDNAVITDNVVKDVGYASGGVSVGFEGIGIRNSANSLVQNNTVTRVGFGIEIVNGSPSFGYTGDVSGTVVTGNTITGAALIGCPECSHGRAIKFQACSQGDELPIRNVTVTNNYATEFGGQSGGNNAAQGGSGLHLTCGVQYCRIENNTFIGAPTAERCVVIDSQFPSGTPPNPTHHNIINNNTFYSGRGEPGCNGQCSDVEFNNLGPDQIGLDRGSRGSNTLKPTSSGYDIRVRFTHGCSQYSHAWFLYPSGQNFVYQGQSITVAGAGILPPSFFSVIRFNFRNSSGVEIASYQTQRSQSNCVVNQELAYINPSQFSPGLYSVYANYYDGNTDVLYISNDPIGTLDVRAFQSNQPPVASSGGPYSGTVGSAVQFNGSGSFDPDGFISSYQWSFGDGTFGSGATPTHTYSTAGNYTVTLTVTDNGGLQGSASTTAAISTGNQPPVANAGGPYSGTVGSAIQFNGSGSFDPDGFISSYQWTFGDGTSGSGATPSHAHRHRQWWRAAKCLHHRYHQRLAIADAIQWTTQHSWHHPGRGF